MKIISSCCTKYILCEDKATCLQSIDYYRSRCKSFLKYVSEHRLSSVTHKSPALIRPDLMFHHYNPAI